LKVVSGQELWQWRHQAQQDAQRADVPLTELDWLLQEIAGLDRLALRLESFKEKEAIALSLPLSALSELWQQRLQDRVPVQYLVGVAPWRHFLLRVSPAVLIPRPETEQLIDLAIAAVPSGSILATEHWADLGTGSGAIALGLADAFPHATIHAVDCSEAALAIARYNAEHAGLNRSIQFYQGQWFEPLTHLKGQFTGMVSNPPYIPQRMIAELQPEVSHHEPHRALDGGEDGLDCIRHLIATAPDYLQTNGIWLIEMMAGQASMVVDLLEAQGAYHHISVHSDLAGLERFALAYRR